MKKPFSLIFILLVPLLFAMTVLAQDDDEEECELEPDSRAFTSMFRTSECTFRNRYFFYEQQNPYFIMEPGWQIVLAGEDDGEEAMVVITVLDETEMVAGVHTRVIEEREYVDDELVEISRNFFAICIETNDIYYFGEDVEDYEDGEVVSSEGAWRVGENGATPGLIMPGTILLGARFQTENSPDEAEDRAEIINISNLEIDDVVYGHVVLIEETNPLEGPCDIGYKYFAPGIGNIVDEDLELVEAGWAFRVPPKWPFKK